MKGNNRREGCNSYEMDNRMELSKSTDLLKYSMFEFSWQAGVRLAASS